MATGGAKFDRLINNRQLQFCPTLAALGVNELIVECGSCKMYCALCCSHRLGNSTCHNCMLVLTDGACSGNGEENARAGLGIALGSDERMWLSIPVDHEIDGNARRTSQRAELLAAIYGLKFLYETRDPDEPTCKDGRKRGHSSAMDSLKFAVATDSEYVVKGITQWFPTWRENGWRNSQGRLPANLDLFKRLDDLATEIERFGYKVGFWHINREYNAVADRLAKNATRF